ncbi:MAG: hypothetical protein COB40_06335 [Marinosulfonomonas sp.]|nr:MAG: hypothetical protein COB40_06335 [Marinosulfonomonas sp.]
MISRVSGAIIRAMLVVLLIATPSILLPGVSPDGKQIVALVAIFGAALTIFEYASTYPGLIEFRDAPPFNRIRFFSLFSTVFLLSLISRGTVESTALTQFVQAVGALIAYAIDFPYSPVRLVVLMLPEGTAPEHIALVRITAGMAYLISLVTLAIFMIILRVWRWPTANGSFNVWVNLPTFDPTAGKDVVQRLEMDARFNIALGFLLPFLTPAVVKSASSLFGSVSLENPQTLVWTVSAWAFLPASLFMRGIAMGRVAEMIAAKRKQNYAKAEEGGVYVT